MSLLTNKLPLQPERLPSAIVYNRLLIVQNMHALHATLTTALMSKLLMLYKLLKDKLFKVSNTEKHCEEKIEIDM